MFRKLFNLNHRLQPEVRLRRAELLHHDLQLLQTETSGVARVKFLDLFPGELLELDVGDAFEAPRLVAEDQPDVANLSDRREKLLDVLRAAPLRQLHYENGSRVALLRRQHDLRRALAHRASLPRRT